MVCEQSGGFFTFWHLWILYKCTFFAYFVCNVNAFVWSVVVGDSKSENLTWNVILLIFFFYIAVFWFSHAC